MTAAGRVVRVAPGEGPSFRIGRDTFQRKGPTPKGTGGFSVIEYAGAAGQGGPPPHVHRSFEEAWYILEGRVEFLAGRSTVRAGPGAYLFVPRGTPHTFRVLGRSPARWIGIFSPGRYVGLVERLGPLLSERGPPDERKLRRLFAEYDSEIVGP